MAPLREITFLPHLLDADEPLPSHLARRLAFLVDLARYASLGESGSMILTPVRCRKRPARKACTGTIAVRRRDLPAAIEWQCTACESNGQITGWEGTSADLRESCAEPVGETESVSISTPAFELLRDLACDDPGLLGFTYRSRSTMDGDVQLQLTKPDAGQLAKRLVAHQFRHSRSRRGRVLRELIAECVTAADDPSEFDVLAADLSTAEDVIQFLRGLPDVAPPEFIPNPVRPRPRSTSPHLRGKDRNRETYQIKVTLRDAKPPIWRRLLIPADIDLPSLHRVLQVAFGWYDCHLHSFRVGHEMWSPPGDYDPLGADSTDVPFHRIAPEKGSKVEYVYDFGDDWRHSIVVEEITDEMCKRVRCMKGRRAGPPEDSGGVWRYQEMLTTLGNPAHPMHDELAGWFPKDFDPSTFDVIGTDEDLRSVPLGNRP